MLATTTSNLNVKSTQELRTKSLLFASALIDQLKLGRKTRDGILFLVDLMLSKEHYAPKNPELLCVSSIIFVMKFEDDFNEAFKGFFHFVLHQMKLDIKEIHKYEIKIINELPNYFIFIPTFKEMIDAILKIVSGKANYELDLVNLEEIVINKYITASEPLSFATLIVDTIVGLAANQEQLDKGYDLVRAVFVVNHLKIV